MAKVKTKLLGDALHEYKRTHPDITWADIADAIGISLQSLFNYVNGRTTPRASVVTTIAKVLEIDAEALLETEEEPEKEKDIIEPAPPKDDKKEPEEKEKTAVQVVVGNTKQKMTVRDVCETVVSDLKITFDEDPNRGTIDVIITVSAEPTEILSEDILNLEVNLMMAKGDAIIISTNSRR